MAELAPGTFDARDVTVTAGSIILDGAGEGDVVTVAFMEDDTSEVVGAQGFVVVSANPNQSGTIVWNGSQNSPANKRLAALANLTRNGRGIQWFPIQVAWKSGEAGLLAYGIGCIKKMPEAKLGREPNNWEWTFFVPNLKFFPGGELAVGGIGGLE